MTRLSEPQRAALILAATDPANCERRSISIYSREDPIKQVTLDSLRRAGLIATQRPRGHIATSTGLAELCGSLEPSAWDAAWERWLGHQAAETARETEHLTVRRVASETGLTSYNYYTAAELREAARSLVVSAEARRKRAAVSLAASEADLATITERAERADTLLREAGL